MSKEKKQRKPWSKNRKIKLAVWLIVIASVIFGFAHQYYIHTDNHIKNVLENNKTLLNRSAEELMQKPTNSDELVNSITTDENRITKDSKMSIGFLKDNPYYEDISDDLYALEDMGIQDVKSTEKAVRFYASSRYVLIYAPNEDKVDGAEPAGDGWFYIKSF